MYSSQIMELTTEELNEVIYCLEEMASAYQDGHDSGIDHYSSALDKCIHLLAQSSSGMRATGLIQPC